MFGHPIQLNFNKEGNTKNSFIGGIVSICLKISMFVFVMINLKKLVLSEDDQLMSEEFLLKHEDLEAMNVTWKELKFQFTPSIRKIRDNQYDKNFTYNEETKKYIRLEFAIHEKWIDGAKTDTNEGEKEKRIPARLCNENDFGANDEIRELFVIS